MLIPVGDKVLVRPLEPESKSPGGILLPDAAKGRRCRGTVVATGPGRREKGRYLRPEVKEADVILFETYSANEVEEDGETFFLIGQDNILARIQKKEGV